MLLCNYLSLSLCCLSSGRQYIWWFCGRLGRKRRKIIPACVVLAIRKQFPEADGNHTGFKDPSITELDLAFFE